MKYLSKFIVVGRILFRLGISVATPAGAATFDGVGFERQQQGWAKPTGRREVPPDDRLRVPTIPSTSVLRWWAGREGRRCPPYVTTTFAENSSSVTSSIQVA